VNDDGNHLSQGKNVYSKRFVLTAHVKSETSFNGADRKYLLSGINITMKFRILP